MRTNSGINKRQISLVVFVSVILFFYIPLLVLILYSFNSGKTMVWRGFSLQWYEELFFHSSDLWSAFRSSLIVALSSSFIATAIGTIGGIGIHWYKFKWKKYLQIVTYLPLIMPEIIIGVSLLIMFAWLKWKMSLFTIFLAHTTFNIPFVLLIISSRLDEFDYQIIEAAHDLGAKEIDTLLKVIIPMSIPGIISGFLMSMTLSLDDFVITFFVSGPGSSTLPLHIYSMINRGVFPVINALSTVLIAGTVLLSVSSKNIQKYMFK
ncbi:MAG: spermidine/putrescine ABC transporter permease [Spirochaetes bacterium GWF1_31_7]|nr:MAG: spermidine/putrescine ABC transporter permease [Spirochaetes bacterium GWE1_32_154]OHD48316.1 MAG: spermidine/putrescine ABC transporter permease [Spirochaetes bacterium GWE2_31_10]OHD49304.1 MAG: spermidine/putrescine ABC transporter permease [Spirochaetes bacterium GWF1_31_7]OHD81132.1 MAG: spermidine/putrescine ABC transporter permease [Spirochaetes bacterium RIFOXYB1_FULL_32_8]HBD92956.1 spermidine/putrescine ABC transporter permease [Spirochaetia bacterium]